MGFDRNTITGFVLLAVLFMGYFWYISSNQNAAKQANELEKRRKDSIAAVLNPVDTLKQRQDSVRRQLAQDSSSAGDLVAYANGTEAFTYVENNLMRLTFSNKGGWLKKVELKKFKGPDSLMVKMGGGQHDEFGYAVRTSNTNSTETNKLYFNPAVVTKAADGSQTISYQVAAGGKSISHSFVVRADDYMVDANLSLGGADQMVTGQTVNIHWNTEAQRQQHDIEYEKSQTKLVYRTGEDFDYNTAAASISEQLDKPTQWIGLKQQFFNSTLLSKTNMNGVQADVSTTGDTAQKQIAVLKTTARIPVSGGSQAAIALQLYSGPNDYYILKKYDNQMHNIVDLGSGMFSFVKYINRWLILPVFEFLTKITGAASIGWAILLLTIIIRLLIAPLTYTSYLSGAKMKALRPEIDAMKARLGNDQQAVSMEQMKLFREAGVNPLGGCIPALFQIPIFFALYSFFNSNIDLRGVPFLWANDLSMYDSIVSLPFSGSTFNHVSLFTITACLTSFAISLYSMSSTPDTGNPMMKYMPYIFPFMMLFFFNKLPSALTWYYTVSNAITLILQFIIQNYIIDHAKILEKIKANRAAPKKKSKMQERLEAMQQTQQKVEDMKKKSQQGRK